MRIIIIGAGITGLSFYLWLDKLGLTKTHEISIYESRETSSASASRPLNDTDNTDASGGQIYDASKIGGALGLAANGLNSIKRFDGELYDELMRTGHVINSWRLSTARGWTLGDVKSPQGEEGVMVLREEVWRLLRKRVPDAVVRRGKVVGMELTGEGVETKVRFEGGEEVVADLVVGADGIWSAVRKAMFGDEEGEYAYAPHYEGLVGVGGYLPASEVHDVPDGQMNVVFGKNGFFGYGWSDSSSEDPSKHGNTCVWWSTHSLKECPSDWRSIDLEKVNNDLRERHKPWKNNVVQSIIKAANVPHLWPTFTTPLLPTWTAPGVVLIGDAAHALTPSSGQGASMGLEDSETLALLLAHHLEKDESGVQLAVKQYDELRVPRLGMIHKKAQETANMKQDMSVAEEMIMYFFIWLMSYFQMNEKYQKQVQSYDVRKAVEDVIKKE